MDGYSNAQDQRRNRRNRLGIQVGGTLAVLALVGGLMAYAPGLRSVSPIVTPEAATIVPEKFVYFPSQFQLRALEVAELPAQF